MKNREVVKRQWKIGALLSAENHAWFHKQTREAQAEMNRRFQEYKKCEVVYVDHLDLGFKVNVMEFTIEPRERKGKYDRAKENREFRKRVDEELDL